VTSDDGDERAFLARSRYMDLKYSPERAPRTAYPDLLARWLLDNVYGRPGRLLDLGAGRGDHLASFERLGFDVVGVDVNERSPELGGGLRIETVDLEAQPLPFDPEHFDFVFTKSVIEHLRTAASVLARVREVLLPGGRIAVMTPSWAHTYKRVFYSEYTHVRPFTQQSLHEALLLAGFEDVRVRPFRQLPFLWRHPVLEPAVAALAAVPLPYRPLHRAPWPPRANTLVRFSKEVMLLGTAARPS
jgi:SAM-dependent methyltransferase